MKTNYIIPLIIILGVLVLFLFPNPEDNIIAYFGVMILLIAIVIFLLIRFGSKK